MTIRWAIITWIASILILINSCSNSGTKSNQGLGVSTALNISNYLSHKGLEFSNSTVIFVPPTDCVACKMHAAKAIQSMTDTSLILVVPKGHGCLDHIRKQVIVCIEYSAKDERTHGLRGSFSSEIRFVNGEVSNFKPLVD